MPESSAVPTAAPRAEQGGLRHGVRVGPVPGHFTAARTIATMSPRAAWEGVGQTAWMAARAWSRLDLGSLIGSVWVADEVRPGAVPDGPRRDIANECSRVDDVETPGKSGFCAVPADSMRSPALRVGN